ncbi:hypothetical protein Y1Q_0007372 [Alligator mississippiensis]|uniref:Uncharacterized protein n=1 Tax=Alligator mississippiensis TaxID=8496 RepID=A0A151P7S1_ALLMI|nr:hypothetical protein Y1Q_0007372 [Alligator mississippiensis]
MSEVLGDCSQELVDVDIQDEIILNMERVSSIARLLSTEEEEDTSDGTLLSPLDLCDTEEVPETQRSFSVLETQEDHCPGTSNGTLLVSYLQHMSLARVPAWTVLPLDPDIYFQHLPPTPQDDLQF